MRKYSFMFGKSGSPELMSKNNLIGYIFQPKYSGIRVLLYKEGDNIQIIDRLNKDITFKFPELLDVWYNLKEDCILDCEIIVLDDHKNESNNLLEIRNILNKKSDIDSVCSRFPAKLMILDILEKNQISLIERTLRDRMRIIDELFQEKNQNLIAIAERSLDGKDFFEKTKEKYIGVMAKDLNSKYDQSIRSWNWLKIEKRELDNFVILGYKKLKNNEIELLIGKYNSRFDSWKIQGKTKIKDKERISNLKKTIKIKSEEEYNLEKKHEKIEESDLLNENFKMIIPSTVIELFLDNLEFNRIRFDKKAKDCILEIK